MFRGRRSCLVHIAVLVATLAVGTANAEAAITISRAELNGTQLRVEGTGALPSHSISVSPGAVPGTSDSNGAFKVSASPYTSSTCRVSVTDGATTASARLSGSTATTPAPTP